MDCWRDSVSAGCGTCSPLALTTVTGLPALGLHSQAVEPVSAPARLQQFLVHIELVVGQRSRP